MKCIHNPKLGLPKADKVPSLFLIPRKTEKNSDLLTSFVLFTLPKFPYIVPYIVTTLTKDASGQGERLACALWI